MELYQTITRPVDFYDYKVVEDKEGKKYAVIALRDDEFSHECPLAWNDDGFTIVREPVLYGYSRDVLKPLDAHGESEIWEHCDTDELPEALIKHYTRKGYLAKYIEIHGNTRGDWVEGVYVSRDGYDGSDELKAWFAGEVYLVGAVPLADDLDTDVYMSDLENVVCGIYESKECSAIDFWLNNYAKELDLVV